MSIIKTILWVLLAGRAGGVLDHQLESRSRSRSGKICVIVTKTPGVGGDRFVPRSGSSRCGCYHRATRWQLQRRISSLETAARSSVTPPNPHRPAPRPRTNPVRRRWKTDTVSNPVYLAVDLPQLDAASALAEKVKAHVGGLKLGLEFFCAHGHHGVHEIAHVGPADLPRSEAARHPQHRRRGDAGDPCARTGDRHGPCQRRARDDGRREGRGRRALQGDRA